MYRSGGESEGAFDEAVNLIGFVRKDAEVKAAQDNSTNLLSSGSSTFRDTSLDAEISIRQLTSSSS